MMPPIDRRGLTPPAQNAGHELAAFPEGKRSGGKSGRSKRLANAGQE
jgi:hypothetical protein